MSDTLIPHEMRISTQGQLRNYVAFALKFLQDNPSRPLTFHTLPPTTPLPPSQPFPSKPSKAASKTPQLVPKLISTVEIVKREYVKLLAVQREEQALARRLVKGKGVAISVEADTDVDEVGAAGGGRGLWQYNETGCLEDLPGYRQDGGGRGEERDEVEEAERALERLKEVLGGKVGPKMVHTPFFKVTLSTVPLVEFGKRKGVSSQHILVPSRPNRTKSQARRRRKALAKKIVASTGGSEAAQAVSEGAAASNEMGDASSGSGKGKKRKGGRESGQEGEGESPTKRVKV